MRIIFRLLFCVSVFIANPVFAAPSQVETFVLSAGGQSSPSFPNPPQFACTVYGPPSQVSGLGGVSIPVEGLSACSIAGSLNGKFSAAGPLADTTSVNATFNAGANNFTGSADTVANFGILRAKAHGKFSGGSNSAIVDGAEALARFREEMVFNSPGIPSGQSGEVRFTFFVDGELSVVGPDPFTSAGDVETFYQLGTGQPSYTLMRAQVTRASQEPFLAVPTSFGSVSTPGTYGGFTVALGSVKGGDNIRTFKLPMQFGTPIDLTVGLFTYVIPSTGAEVDVNFYSTLELSGIEVFNQGSQAVPFSIVAASGTKYDASGLRIDSDGDGVSVSEGDCNDSNFSIFPGAAEICDGLDNDCDAIVDDGVSGIGGACSTGLLGLCSTGTSVCTGGAIVCSQTVFPAPETCDGLDNDCNGLSDDGFDLDGDGTPDCTDSCPSDAKKIAPGLCGCGVSDEDIDGDGTPNCNDGCPSDGAKSSKGVCGCGIADLDSDGDKTFDCSDECPADALKVAAGSCGCFLSEDDSDGDGSADCFDSCPVDSLKIEPGSCGCGKSDVDADGDGEPDCPATIEINSLIKKLKRAIDKYTLFNGKITAKGRRDRQRANKMLDRLGLLVTENAGLYATEAGNPTVTELSTNVVNSGKAAGRATKDLPSKKRQAIRDLVALNRVV